jgi:hypothetical protein
MFSGSSSAAALWSNDIIEKIKVLDHSIRDNIETLPVQDVPEKLQDLDDDACTPYLPVEPDVDEYTSEECDNLITAEVLLPNKGDILVTETVIS